QVRLRLGSCDVYVVVFFQAEDGIRDWSVTGVQTCALPILRRGARGRAHRAPRVAVDIEEDLSLRVGELELEGALPEDRPKGRGEIGRASCRERVEAPGVERVCTTAEVEGH